MQTEGHTLTPMNGQNGPKETEASGSTSSCSLSQSLASRKTTDCCDTWYFFEIQVISTKDGGTILPPPHAWQVPVVEDML